MRKALPQLLAILLLTGLSSPLPAPENEGKESTQKVSIQQENSRFRDKIVLAMSQAAKLAKVRIDTKEMAIASRGHVLIATVPAAGNDGFDMFVYLDISRLACSKTLPRGFYHIKMPYSRGTDTVAQFRDSTGRDVLALPASFTTHPEPDRPQPPMGLSLSFQAVEPTIHVRVRQGVWVCGKIVIKPDSPD